jgi:hypothetical protein
MIELSREQHIVTRDSIQISESTSRFCEKSPCDLLMVIEKAKHIGNCLLLNLKGIFVSDGMGGMHGMRTVSKFNPSIARSSTMFL